MHTMLATAVREHLDHKGVFQAIHNIGYREWQKNRDWTIDHLINWVHTNYGDLGVFAILMGKYNQQVTNGGHCQYFVNHYCGESPSQEFPLHHRLITLAAKFGFENHPVYTILSDLSVDMVLEDEFEDIDCSGCGGSGTIEIDCEACEGLGCEACDCGACDGAGTFEELVAEKGTIENEEELDALNTRYYALEESWMAELETFFRQKLAIADHEIPSANIS